MGIRTLNSFVQKEFKDWRKAVVQGKLIIDGFLLCHALFNDHLTSLAPHPLTQRIRTVSGGDYISFAEYIKNFFVTLKHNKIEPFVIFDGTNFDLKKTQTGNHRALQQSVTVTKLLRSPANVASNEHILPLLSRDVMLHTLRSVLSDDHFYVADCDADVDIASFAISHKCPVLSDDSDFYVFPLTHGYIPYPKFCWHDADKAGAIYGEFYSCELFRKQFGIADQELLALLPAIIGNDTIPPLDQYMSKILSGKCLVHSIIKYAANFKTIGECQNTLRRQEIIDSTMPIQNLETAFQDYFVSSQEDYGGSKTLLTFKDGIPLPDFILQRFRTGRCSKLVIDVVCLQSVALKIAIEDKSQKCCHQIGSPVRKLIYGILCGDHTTIKEKQRPDENSVSVRASTSITYHGDSIALPSLDFLCTGHEIDSAKKILYAALGYREKEFKKLSRNYRLLLGITRYWHNYSKVQEKTVFLQSFLLFLQEPKKVAIIKHSVQDNHSGNAGLVQICKELFSLNLFVHAVSQWQSLYSNVHCLNQLLQQPLPLPEPSEFLECSNLFSYTIAVAQEGVSQVIQQNSLDKDAYEAFFAVTHTAVDEPMPKMVTSTSDTHTDSSRAPGNVSASSDSLYSCRNRFASLSTDLS